LVKLVVEKTTDGSQKGKEPPWKSIAKERSWAM
jgi:hypothetical protein